MTFGNPASAPARRDVLRCLLLALFGIIGFGSLPALAATEHVSEASLVLPDLADRSLVAFFGTISGWTLLSYGLLVCLGGLVFGGVIYSQIRRLPVHRAMAEVSDLIYETCKTYMITQGKFLLILEAFTAAIMIGYFYFVQQLAVSDVALILAFSLVGIAGSYMVAWFGIRINTLANSRTAFASLAAKPFPVYAIPIKSGIAIGMLLISTELLIMLGIMLFVPPSLAGKCFIGFAIGESLGAAALRIAGGIFTKIADIGSDLMKIEFGIQEDDARNPGVIADCAGDNAGDSVGPTADGFETYGVTGVALISFLALALAANPALCGVLIVWLFAMRILMVITSLVSYWVNDLLSHSIWGRARDFNLEQPLTNLVFITSGVSIAFTYLMSYLLIPSLNGDATMWWKLASNVSAE